LLRPTLGDLPRGLVETVAAAGLHLDLRGDQLARKVCPQLAAFSRRLDVLEAVHEGESGGIQDRELLLHRKREVRSLFELLAREVDLLVRAELLLVAHLPLDGSRRDGARSSSSKASGSRLRRDPSSSA
jgi:hypothetical protein